ncbi:MAG: hypothetical protein NDJ90_16155 [Oligoflexia bacterium]|nr:hypothetical protein [Oligoflexia bacterium]
MTENKPGASDQVTVLVFKDNFSARTFKVSLRWITRLGALAGFILTLTLVSGYFAVKNTYALRETDPTHVRELEQELRDLKAAYQGLEARKAAQPEPTVSESAPTDTPSPAPSPMMEPPALPGPVVLTPQPQIFAAFPTGTRNAPDFASPPISIDTPKFSWSGRNLQVKFNIQYVREQGSQQGRIVLIGRGPDLLVAYPGGIFNASGATTLIAPDKGEYFSLSRFREVRAELGPIAAPEKIREVEAILFDTEGRILIHRLFPVAASATRSAPPRKAPPTASAASGPATPASPAPASPTPNPGANR